MEGEIKRAKEDEPETTEIRERSLFTASLGLKSDVHCTDIDNDASLYDVTFVQRLEKSGVSLAEEELHKPRTYLTTVSDSNRDRLRVVLKRAITVEILLHIRYADSLRQRGVRWLVTEQKVGEAFLGRPLLESLGFACTELVEEASIRYNRDLDAASILAVAADKPLGRIVRIVSKLFYEDEGVEPQDAEDETAVGCTSGKIFLIKNSKRCRINYVKPETTDWKINSQ